VLQAIREIAIGSPAGRFVSRPPSLASNRVANQPPHWISNGTSEARGPVTPKNRENCVNLARSPRVKNAATSGLPPARRWNKIRHGLTG
jgi:hypothetical protein